MKKNELHTGKLFDTGSNGGEASAFDWGSVDPSRLSEIIQLVTSRGGAIRFGYTRDGNAGSIGVYYGDQRDTVYIRPNGDSEESLGLIERTFSNKPRTGGKVPEKG